jgi:hypothetical protein
VGYEAVRPLGGPVADGDPMACQNSIDRIGQARGFLGDPPRTDRALVAVVPAIPSSKYPAEPAETREKTMEHREARQARSPHQDGRL